MNVSMMDSYNLAWKLAYTLHGLTPNTSLLDTYHTERSTIAHELIDLDRTFSSMFSGKIGEQNGSETLSHDQFLTAFNTGHGFTSGCGIEYPENPLVDQTDIGILPEKREYLSGMLRPGRRLLNVTVKRHADGSLRDLHDDLYAGRFHVLVLTSTDVLSAMGVSSSAINILGAHVLPSFPSVVELTVIHPRLARDFLWGDVPGVIKDRAEMQFYEGVTMQDVYAVYGIPPEQGIMAVIRPDGYVGTLARLDDVDRIDEYLRRCLQKVHTMQ
ncbi:thioredoxin-like protein [Aspergillus coremiiformis]|uniref:Thioredoxin-like protein n=1 Tax=Aspergillus coremiiformis TaxID=138285 RepID=A0A5N6ZE49_9EURO|nr:thioredoxin-like protein [Aspergillus coremiiformis]